MDRKQLAVIIMVWLRALPKWAWGKDPAYERTRGTWRHKPDEEPDPKRMAAELIAAKVEELGWTVSYDERPNPFSDRPSSAESGSARTEEVKVKGDIAE